MYVLNHIPADGACSLVLESFAKVPICRLILEELESPQEQ